MVDSLVPWRNFGKIGVIADTVGEALPVGAWTDARNMRFSGLEAEKMLEPVLRREFPYGTAVLEQGWNDGFSTFVAVATRNQLWFLRAEGPAEADTEWVLAGEGYDPDGEWQAFPWGDTVIFNNGVDAPQIFDSGALAFIDLPGWGVVSTADDISEGRPPSRDTRARCKVLLPYKGFLVACGISEEGYYQPNAVWWSGVTRLAGLSTRIAGSGPPDWDYENPGSLSGKAEVGAGDGAIRAAARLNENVIIYTDRSANALTAVGGTAVMATRRLFNKGCAGLHLVQEFNNRHFVVARDQLYVHDGSTVQQIAKDRVEDEFFRRVGRSGRFGGGGNVDFSDMQLAKDPLRKELWLSFSDVTLPNDIDTGLPVPPPVVYGELLYAEERLQRNYSQLGSVRGALAISGSQMLCNAGGNEFIYSADLGQTWQRANTPIADLGWSCTVIDFAADEQRWYTCWWRGGNRESRWYTSPDNGMSWQRIDPPDGNERFGPRGLVVDEQGRAVLGYRSPAVSGVRVRRYAAPFDGTSEVYDYVDPDGNPSGYSGSNLEEFVLAQNGIVFSVWNGVFETVAWVDDQLQASVDYNYNTQQYRWAYWSKGVPDAQGVWEHAVWKEDSGSSTVFRLWREDATPGAALPEVTFTFSEGVNNGRVDWNGRYLVCAANTSGGAQNRLLLRLSASFDPAGFTDQVEVRLPTNIDFTRRWGLVPAEGNFWVVHYTENDYTRVVLVNLDGRPRPRRTALVWNYEDDTYTWADPSVIVDDGAALEDVVWMNHRFDSGWMTRYSSPLVAGLTYTDMGGPQAPWSQGSLPPRYMDFARAAREQRMHWLTAWGQYEADVEVSTSKAKYVFLERKQLDLDDLNPRWTTNQYKYLDQFVFHLQTPYPVNGGNYFKITAGWADNLMDPPTWSLFDQVTLAPAASGGKYKWDVRTSGRYLSIRMDFDPTQEVRLTGADVGVEPMYGQ